MEWQIGNFQAAIIFGVFVGFNVNDLAKAQELVPNGGFYYNDSCQVNSLPDVNIEPWLNVYSTPDFLHPCFPTGESVPLSAGGGEEAFVGEGYAGLFTYRVTEEKREFIATPLNEELSAGISYHATVHVSLMDSAVYATKSIGMLFSESSQPADLAQLFNQVPQVQYDNDSFLVNKNGWSRIEGSFVASGGERFLTIGNFKNDDETDTLFVGGGGFQPANPNFWRLAYYYIDGVSVIPDSIYLSNDDPSSHKAGLKMWPNPASNVVNVDFSASQAPLEMTVRVVDMFGRQFPLGKGVSRNETGDSVIEINTSSLPNGIYLITVTDHDGNGYTQRLVIQH